MAFKLSVVEFYRRGEHSVRGVYFGIDQATVRKWGAIHEAHGAEGLMKKFSPYDAEFKLSVLKRMWEDGLSHRQSAAMFNIRNKSCLSDWERRYKTGGIDALAPHRRGSPRAMPKSEKPPEPQVSPSDDAKSREELLAELNYLRMENAYLKNSRP
jgi:transposase